jgi:hypothetical protein
MTDQDAFEAFEMEVVMGMSLCIPFPYVLVMFLLLAICKPFGPWPFISRTSGLFTKFVSQSSLLRSACLLSMHCKFSLSVIF